MNGRPSFEPYDFLGRLKRDEIFVPIVVYGMVKPAEDDDDYLLFAHGNACKNWFRIPLSSIENVSVLRFVPCDDHKHPLVSLVLKQPETEEGQLFCLALSGDFCPGSEPVVHATTASLQQSAVRGLTPEAVGSRPWRPARTTSRGLKPLVRRLPGMG